MDMLLICIFGVGGVVGVISYLFLIVTNKINKLRYFFLREPGQKVCLFQFEGACRSKLKLPKQKAKDQTRLFEGCHCCVLTFMSPM